MRRLLIDTNVVLDVVLDREPHSRAAAALLSAVDSGRVEGHLAAHGFTTVFYLVAKQQGRQIAHTQIRSLLTFLRVAAVDHAVLRRASLLEIGDFEDAVTCSAAEAAGCEAIVTRDAKGFRSGPVRAISPDVALATLHSEVNEPVAAYDSAPRRRRRSRKRS